MNERGIERLVPPVEVPQRLQTYRHQQMYAANLQLTEIMYQTYDNAAADRVVPDHWAAWQDAHPRPEPEVLQQVLEANIAERTQLAAELGLPSVEYLDDLMVAHEATKGPRQAPGAEPAAELVVSAAPLGIRVYDLYNGLVTLSRLTGESYKLVGEPPHDSRHFQVTADTPYLVDDPSKPYAGDSFEGWPAAAEAKHASYNPRFSAVMLDPQTGEYYVGVTKNHIRDFSRQAYGGNPGWGEQVANILARASIEEGLLPGLAVVDDESYVLRAEVLLQAPDIIDSQDLKIRRFNHGIRQVLIDFCTALKTVEPQPAPEQTNPSPE